MSSEQPAFRDKLRRLRREEVREEAHEKTHEKTEPPKDSAEPKKLPKWLRHKLARRAKALPTGRGASISRTPGSEAPEGDGAATEPDFYREEGDPSDLREGHNALGCFCFRETVLDASSQHGNWRLDEVRHADPTPFALLCGNKGLATLDLEKALFLDTETSGLGGGAGMYVFMVGLGFFHGTDFHVWQGFLREPHEEAALLEETARLIRESGSLVSFFGKSFDRHRLEDKMRIAGVEPPFADLPHLDLYHPLKRLTKGDYPDGRLRTMESELCGLHRQDDLPGAFAPAAWFDYLAERPHSLAGVFKHNLDDVLSLVTLAAWLGRIGTGHRHDLRPLAGNKESRARELARALEEDHDRIRALDVLDNHLGGLPVDAQPRAMLLQRAELLRHLGRRDQTYTDQARGAFESILETQDSHYIKAAISLAKLLEHEIKDHPAAHKVCEAALHALPRLHPSPDSRDLAKDLDKRLARLSPSGHRTTTPE